MKVLIVGIGALGGTLRPVQSMQECPFGWRLAAPNPQASLLTTADVGCLVAARPELIFAAGVPRRRANLHPSCRD